MNQVKNLAKTIYEGIKDECYLALHLEYRLLQNKYNEYRWYVRKGKKTFDIYIHESITDLQLYEYSLDESTHSKRRKEKVHGKISSIFLLRNDLVRKYFEEPVFNFESAMKLLSEYDSTTIFFSAKQSSETINQPIIVEESLSHENRKKKVIDLSIIEAKRYYKFKNKSIHMGTRIGGYLFISEYLKDSETESRRQIWERLTDFHFGDEVYLSSPWTVKSSPVTTINHLNELLIFFKELRENNTIGDIVDNIIELIQRDIKKLQKK